jgi:hypothetical protein
VFPVFSCALGIIQADASVRYLRVVALMRRLYNWSLLLVQLQIIFKKIMQGLFVDYRLQHRGAFIDYRAGRYSQVSKLLKTYFLL